MNLQPSGLPEDRPQFDLTRYFKVVDRKSSVVDENVNDRIQKEGCECWGGCNEQPLTGGEAEWYMKHKGYSKKGDL